MKISLTQMDIIWEDKDANWNQVITLLEEAKEHESELIVFPEMTLTGFSMDCKKVGEERKAATTVSAFLSLSKEYDLAIGFGYVEIVNDKCFNRFAMVKEGKMLGDYAKIHTFTYGGESEIYAKGDQLVQAKIDEWSFGMFICYDLRFPELFQESSKQNQGMIVIANWPKERVEQWLALLKARAIETQSYVIGVNRTGEGNGLFYEKSSCVFGPSGEKVSLIQTGSLLHGYIDSRLVQRIRADFPVWKDRQPELYSKLSGAPVACNPVKRGL